MKRRFTILTAAFMLLAFLAIPMGMMGQAPVNTVLWEETWTGGDTGETPSAYGFEGTTVYGGVTLTYAQSSSSTKLYAEELAGGTSPELLLSKSNQTWTISNIPTGQATGMSLTFKSNKTTFAVTTTTSDITISGSQKSWTINVTGSVANFDLTIKNTGSSNARIDDIELIVTTAGASTNTVATPTFSPVAGTYTQTQTVSISCATEGATIYYTTDGNDPTTNSTVYTAAISVSSNMTIKAMATAEGYNNSAVATAEYAFITLDHAGTLADPYTVSDAHTAIDANAGTQNVYATGIVSAIPTAYNSTYGNITFNMIDEEGDEVFLQAYRCGGDEAANVAVGDVAVVYGNLIKYGSTYEFGQGCQLVSLTHPVINIPTVTVTPNTINAPAEGADGSLALTYENITNFISFDYNFCDANGGELEGNDPDWIYAEINEENDAYTLSYIIDANDGAARTAYMKVYTFDDNEEEVYAIVTVNQEEYVAPTYAELPFAFNGGKADIEGTDGLYEGDLGTDYNATNNPNTKLKFDGTGDWLLLQFNERPGTLTFDIKNNSFSGGTFKVQTSEDGVTYTDLETYTEITGTQNEEFTDLGENVRYIKWIYTNKASGNVGLGNIALAEYVAPALVASIIVNPDEVELDAEEHDGTLDLTYESLTITDMTDFDIQFCDANGEELSEEPDWIEVLVAEQDPEIGEGYVVSYYMVENEGPDARTAYFKVYAMDDETNLVYSNLVTISQAAPVAPVTGDKYVKVTSTDDLTSGQYLIVYEEGSLAFDGGLATLDAASNTIEVILNDDEIDITSETAAAEFTIDITAGTIKSASGYYIGRTSDSNGMNTSATEAYTNSISIDDSGNAVVVASSGAYLRYNANSGQDRFRYFKSSSYTNQKAIQLYKKVGEEPATETYTLENITGYTGEKDHYFLIASPVTVDLTNHDMTTGDFDLYYFDESQELEWRNYEATLFNLVPGTGYLYAKKATTEGETFSFELTGTPYSGNGTVDLTYTENAEFAGFNLIGNPFGTNAILDLPYYRLNSDGSALNTTTESSEINVMEGVFVQATAANQKANFTKVGESAKKIGQLNVKVTRNRSVILDNAIIRFDNGAMLGKFQLNVNSTKLYFTEGNQDFAVVRSANEGEMPVNFKAAENGNYTLSIETENVEMSYLHLIDNMTGADVDLLATPSYSFEARTNDYTNRFRLVFNANSSVNEQNSETFAFFNGSNLVINNEGEATLQVIDMMGRMISSEQIQGSYSNSLNLSAGVYVLRLSNGNTVKTQKIVVD